MSWSAGLIAIGLLLKIALSPVDESLGTWAGGAAAFGGVVIVPSVMAPFAPSRGERRARHLRVGRGTGLLHG